MKPPSGVAKEQVSTGQPLRAARSWPAAHVVDTCLWERRHVRFQSVPAGRKSPTDRFHRFCVATVARLPWHLNSVVAPTFLGFALINGLTFGVDLLLLSGLHAGLRMPIPFAVTVAYGCAFTLSYFLNRTMNFASHAPVGPQLAVYLIAVLANYLAFVLGLSSALTALGVDFRLSRILAGCCEAVFIYSAMRLAVFRR